MQVTRSFLPGLDEYVALLEGVWETGQLTNHGPLVTRLESRLRDYLDVDHLFAICNGTVALQIAIEALEFAGDVITTPFSYVATTSSLVWQHCRPVFADIDRESLAIDPAAIESVITPETTGILATHVYGFPCDIDGIGRVAEKYGLKIIYDAAHCFGARFRGRGMMRYGDAAISSFHATKIFHCAEGGAVTVSDSELAERVAYMRNFGHKGREDFHGIGINGKLSELHAAMGLAVFEHVEDIIASRRAVVEDYWQRLDGVEGLRFLKPGPEVDWNYAYLPVVLPDERAVESVRDRLAEASIYPRRYFYPPLHRLPGLEPGPSMPVAEEMATRVMCLPVFPGIEEMVVEKVASEIARAAAR
ncbi:MAG: DegT/DnrJ/EryC1/StrS family aminotransferase [Verrucomicrobiae bacterium]|nr:DegT/DnrJ/EryC1/StrS family aminotransferase [Verrucomicrobiae bacterium]